MFLETPHLVKADSYCDFLLPSAHVFDELFHKTYGLLKPCAAIAAMTCFNG
jgi:hypothetical protein